MGEDNLYKEMRFFNQMDVGGKGYITEQEFVDGWSRVAQRGGSSILRRFSDDSNMTPIRRNSTQLHSTRSPNDVANNGPPSIPHALDKVESDIRRVFRSYAKEGEDGLLFVNSIIFSRIYRQVTGQKGNIYNEMKYFKQFDIGNKGYINEGEFVDGWVKYAQDSESPILSQFSAESSSLWSPARPHSISTDANDA